MQLAAAVGLSESACLRRVKLLEENGIIDRYVMLINQVAIGKPHNVFVRVTLDGQQREKLTAFEAEVSRVAEVMECYLMAGDFDYLLRVITTLYADGERPPPSRRAKPSSSMASSTWPSPIPRSSRTSNW